MEGMRAQKEHQFHRRQELIGSRFQMKMVSEDGAPCDAFQVAVCVQRPDGDHTKARGVCRASQGVYEAPWCFVFGPLDFDWAEEKMFVPENAALGEHTVKWLVQQVDGGEVSVTEVAVCVSAA